MNMRRWILFGEERSFEELLKAYPEKLVITQGSRGVGTCLKSGETILVPARKIEGCRYNRGG